MLKYSLVLWAFLVAVWSNVSAQQSPVLMRVNGEGVSRSDFEYAYNRNHASASKDSKLFNAFVDSFIEFRLKVAAAKKAGLDTDPTFCRKQEDYRFRLLVRYFKNGQDKALQAQRLHSDMDASGKEIFWVCQIFKRLPQTVSSFHLRDEQARMDSIYKRLINSPADFAACVKTFSDYKDTLYISKLRTSEEFERVIFALREGEISQPFLTPQGIHIVKLLKRQNATLFEDIRVGDNRRLSQQQWNEATFTLVERLKQEYGYSVSKMGMDELLAKGETDKMLFTLKEHSYTGGEFRRFAEGYPQGVKKQFEAFVVKTVLDYENSHLEQKHPELHQVLNAYKDSLMVAEITRREMDALLDDKAALADFFVSHKSDYKWEHPRFKGVVLHSRDKKVIKLAKKLVKKFPESEWKSVLQKAFNTPTEEIVKVEEGLYAEGSNIYVDKLAFKEGQFAPLKSHPFTVVIGKKQKGPDSVEEVREQLLIDYREALEVLWVKQLRGDGKVEINEEVLKTVNNH